MWIAIGIVAIVLILIVGIYNGLVRSKNRVDEAWSDIDVQLKRRYDLIPNLVNTVKGYATHESSVFEEVTKARAAAQQASTSNLADKQQAEANLSRSIMGIFAVAENYPDLKANQNFQQLQGDLTDTEDKIQAARRFYNGNVRDYNTKLQTFPTNIMASMFGFAARTFFGIDNDAEKQAPQVSF